MEWPQVIMTELPDEYLQLNIKRVDDSWNSTKREVEIQAKGKRNEDWENDILTKFKA